MWDDAYGGGLDLLSVMDAGGSRLYADRRPRALTAERQFEDALARAAAAPAASAGDPADPVAAAELRARPTWSPPTLLAGPPPPRLPVPRRHVTARFAAEASLRDACAAGALQAAAELLDRNVDPDRPEPSSRYTALHWAAAGGHTAVCDLLLLDATGALTATRAATTTTRGGGGGGGSLTAKEEARRVAREGRAARRREAVTADGDTPLLLAAKGGHAATLALLAKRGCKVNVRDRSRGWPALCWCAALNHAAAATALLAAGADFGAKTELKVGSVRRGQDALGVAQAVGEPAQRSIAALEAWDNAAEARGRRNLAQKNEADARLAMARCDAESRLAEARCGALEAERGRLAAALDAEAKQARLDARDAAALMAERGAVEAQVAAAKEDEDWDLFEELEEALKDLPANLAAYRLRRRRRRLGRQAHAAGSLVRESAGMGDADARSTATERRFELAAQQQQQQEEEEEEEPKEALQEAAGGGAGTGGDAADKGAAAAAAGEEAARGETAREGGQAAKGADGVDAGGGDGSAGAAGAANDTGGEASAFKQRARRYWASLGVPTGPLGVPALCDRIAANKRSRRRQEQEQEGRGADGGAATAGPNGGDGEGGGGGGEGGEGEGGDIDEEDGAALVELGDFLGVATEVGWTEAEARRLFALLLETQREQQETGKAETAPGFPAGVLQRSAFYDPDAGDDDGDSEGGVGGG